MAQLKPKLVPPELLTRTDVEAILRIERARALLMGELKAALLARDDQRALQLARKVCGIDQEAA